MLLCTSLHWRLELGAFMLSIIAAMEAWSAIARPLLDALVGRTAGFLLASKVPSPPLFSFAASPMVCPPFVLGTSWALEKEACASKHSG